MTIKLNHTIMQASDREATTTFLTEILGLPDAGEFGPFRVLELGNEISLDVAGSNDPIHPQHYAFLVDEEEFDQIWGRIKQRGLTFWADPAHRREGEINTNDGGRGLYWESPDGHNLEILTVPYGGG